MSRAEDQLSIDLVRSIQAGDEAAWERLYARYRDALLFAIRCRLGSKLRGRIDSEDILQSVVKDAIEDLLRFEPRGPGSLQHYLHVCVLNKIRVKAAYYGTRKREGDESLSTNVLGRAAAEPEGELGYLEPERYERLERSVSALPDNLREVVLLRSIEGLTNGEAAGVLDKSPEATSKLYNRALAQLSLAMGGSLEP